MDGDGPMTRLPVRRAPEAHRWPPPGCGLLSYVRSSLYDSNPGNTHVSTSSEHDAASDRRSSPSSAEACDASNISRPEGPRRSYTGDTSSSHQDAPE